MSSEKKRALVSGSNRGIGYEIVKQLAVKEIDVILTSREIESGRVAAQELGVRYLPLDVADTKSIEDARRALEQEGLDILINNAGVSLSGFDASVVEKTMAVNFFGAMNLTDALLPLIRPRGRIVMISSGMGELSCLSPLLQKEFSDDTLTRERLIALVWRYRDEVLAGRHRESGWPSSAYSVSKVALNALTRILARELSSDPRKILINAVCPGWVKTDMGGPSAPRSVAKGAETPVWLSLLPSEWDTPSGGFFRDQRSIPF